VTFRTITIEQHDNVAVLLLNRPEKLNAFTILMLEELLGALNSIEVDDNLKAVIITGTGRAFCAGEDLSSGKDTFNPSFDTFGKKEGDFVFDTGGILALRMYEFMKPIIFACNGPALRLQHQLQDHYKQI
jgi:enoyl-CoA hydratase/carnithine racemase